MLQQFCRDTTQNVCVCGLENVVQQHVKHLANSFNADKSFVEKPACDASAATVLH